MEPGKSAGQSGCRVGSAQVPSWLAALAAGVGHAIYRPARSPPPWAWRENEAPTTRALVGPPEPPESVSAQSVLAVTMSDLLTIC
jgi:hypothetical protein